LTERGERAISIASNIRHPLTTPTTNTSY